MRRLLISFGIILGFWVVDATAQAKEDLFEPSFSATVQSTIPDSAPLGPLPLGAKPMAYKVHFVIDPRRPDFSSNAEINIDLPTAATGIWMHGTGLNIKQATLMDAKGVGQEVRWLNSEVEGVNWVDFSTPKPAGQYILKIQYTGSLDRNLSGLFTTSNANGAFALAKSESIQARKFLPSFDEPAYKTPYSITIDVPEDLTAISNGALLSEDPIEEGWKRFKFQTTRPLPTYLLSVTVGDFERRDYTPIPPNKIRPHSIPLTGYTQKGKVEQLEFALSKTAELVAFYEEAFALPYPYAKLDIVAAPAWPSGATELAGAITYRESRILIPPNAGTETRHALLRLHTHELTHMWFGNLVTPDWWEDLWLKEAFATWGSPLALDALYPHQGHEEDAIMSGLSAMRLDALSSTRAVKERILDTKNVRSAYDAITYRKGMAIIMMIDAYFGPDIFRPALGKFLQARTDGITNSADFVGYFRDNLGLEQIADTFEAYVETRGMPLVEISKACAPNGETVLALKQEKYSPISTANTIEPNAPIWPIPLCVKGRDATQACTVFKTKSTHLNLAQSCALPFYPNAEGKGYFRFRLQEDDWLALVADFDALSVSEALTAIDNGLTQFEDGALSSGVFDALLKKSIRHNNWHVFTYALDRLEAWMEFVSPMNVEAYQTWLNQLYRPLLERLSFEIPSPERDRALGILTAFLINVVEDKDLQGRIHAMTKAYLDGSKLEVGATLWPSEYASAYSTALRYDPLLFDTLYQRLHTAEDTRERLALAGALGEAAPKAKIPFLLNAIGQGDINLRETYYMLQGLMQNTSHKETVWVWIKAHLPAISQNIPSQWRSRLPGLASSFCSLKAAQDLEQLFEKHGQLAPGHSKSLKQTLERIRNCVGRKVVLEAALQDLF